MIMEIYLTIVGLGCVDETRGLTRYGTSALTGSRGQRRTPKWCSDQGPVVKGIVSRTTSLRFQLVKYVWIELSNTLLFFV